MATFKDDYCYLLRVKKYEEKERAELNFAKEARDTEKELTKLERYFIASVIMLMLSLIGNFLQYVGNL